MRRWGVAARMAGLSLAGALATTACAGQVEWGGDPVPEFSHAWWGHRAEQQWFLLVVDDAPTPAARRLRERLAADLHGFFDEVDVADCGLSADPARYRPVDFRLVIVGASGTLLPRFRDDEGLHAIGADASPELLAAFEEAGGQAIQGMETAEVLPFVGAAELAHYVKLIQGAVKARSDTEEELALLLGRPTWPWMGLATTRRDVSELPLELTWNDNIVDVRLLHWPESGPCPTSPDSTIFPSLEPLRATWTSPACSRTATVFAARGVTECVPQCMDWTPPVDAAGRVECQVFGEFPIHVDCEDFPGWTFLDTTTTQFEGPESWTVNLCELKQAEGPALEACVSDFACEGCEPSFCLRRPFTEADDADPAHRRATSAADSPACEQRTGTPSWDRLRIVQGADQVGGFLRAVCRE